MVVNRAELYVYDSGDYYEVERVPKGQRVICFGAIIRINYD